ncbi:MaoC/PaaZ C-terminal domain-containing protein [Sphingopyxis chilensis]
MPIQYPAVLKETSSGGRKAWGANDAILYALGLGMASDPLDRNELPFVHEVDQKVMPTLAAVLTRGLGVTVAQLGFDYRYSVHGEQAILWHRPIPPQGEITGEGRVVAVYDKGDKGAVCVTETSLRDGATGDLLATVRVTSFARADGHCGAPSEGAPDPHKVPDRAPDLSLRYATRPDLALIYRLSGDMNPLHIDPDAARRAGFDRPILHGLCTYGIACRAVIEGFAGWDPERLASLAARFSAPVFPGDALVIDLWRDGDVISFEAQVPDRGVTVLKNGRAELRGT